MTTTDHHPPPVPDVAPDGTPTMSVRPRLRHDVVFADTGDGVILRRAGEGYVLKGRTAYRFTASLAPFLTGELTVAELCADLSAARVRMVVDFVTELIGRGFARDVRGNDAVPLAAPLAERFADQINYIEHYVDDAVARFLRYRTARVLVVGTGATATAAASSLLQNGLETVTLSRDGEEDLSAGVAADAGHLSDAGCPARVDLVPAVRTVDDLAGYDVVIAPSDGTGAATLARLAAGRADGPVVLPSVVVGGAVVVGPIVRPGGTPCWTCLVLRLGANIDAGEAAALWRDIAVPDAASTRRLHGPLAAMIGNLLAYEAFRLRTGSLEPETVGAVVVQDITTFETRRETLLPHPACPACAPRAGDGGASVAGPDADGSGADAADDELDDPTSRPTDRAALTGVVAELNGLVGAWAGVVTGFDDLGLDQSPLKVSRVRLGAPDGSGGAARSIVAFDLHFLPLARRAAMRVAMLAYVGDLAATPARDRGDAAVAPADLVTHTGVPVDAFDVRSWIPALSLATGARHLVPTAAVHPMSGHNDGGWFERTGAGDGAGATDDGATRSALLSALAYEAVTAAARGAAGRRVPGGPAPTGSELEFLLRTLRTFEVPVDIVDISPAGAGRVVIARTTGGLWTHGVGRSGRRAVVAALRDLVGTVQLRRALGADTDIDLGPPLLTGFDPRAITVDGTVADTWLTAPPARPAEVLAGLAARGLDPVVVPTTTMDLAGSGIVTARALLRRTR